MAGWVTPQDIADIRSFGVTVVEQANWQNKSDGSLSIRGLMLHHDALALGLNSSPNDDFNVPTHMGTPGVLGSQFWVATKGQVVVMAAGGKGHAGNGQWRDIPLNSGNSYCVAIETDHTDGTGWSHEMMYAIDVISYVMVRNHGIDIMRAMCGHKEYAPTRKHDPEGYDLDAWRNRIATGNLYGRPSQQERDWLEMATEAELDAKLDALAKRIVKDMYNTSFVSGRPPVGVTMQTVADRHQEIWLRTNDALNAAKAAQKAAEAALAAVKALPKA